MVFTLILSSIFLNFNNCFNASGCVKFKYWETNIFPFIFFFANSSKVLIIHATPPVVTKATENQNSLQPFNSLTIDDNTFLPSALSFSNILGTKSF